jgi:hypothetical protein
MLNFDNYFLLVAQTNNSFNAPAGFSTCTRPKIITGYALIGASNIKWLIAPINLK